MITIQAQEDFGYIELTSTALQHTQYLFEKYKSADHRYFMVCFTPPYMSVYPEYEQRLGYDPIFFMPSAHALSPQDWDVVLYDTSTYEAVVRMIWRDT